MLYTLFLAATLVTGALSVGTVLAFDWDCTNSLMTCNNACYLLYVYKEDIDTLTYDGKSDDQRKLSGCSKNPCNDNSLPFGKSGTSCDEYPYASVMEGGSGASLRCVPPSDQQSEGGQLQAFYQTFNNTVGQQFNVMIKNYKGAPFCEGTSTSNDGYEFRWENNKFVTYKRGLEGRRNVAGEDFRFAELEGRVNVTAIPRRIFEDDEGEQHLLLGSGEGQTFEGRDIFSDGTWRKLVREV